MAAFPAGHALLRYSERVLNASPRLRNSQGYRFIKAALQRNTEPFITVCMPQSLAKIYVHLIFSTKNREKVIPRHLHPELHDYMGGILQKQLPILRNFHWQNGYGAFSVSQSNLAEVKEYIRNQQRHHQAMSFQEEFRRFLAKYEVEYDERYVWD
jgi:putative transposase